MIAITPHLAALDGELVGALLIFNTGSLLNLAKHQASTVQILGAEKALFRALKTEHDTEIWADIPHLPCRSSATEALKGKGRVISYRVCLDTPQLIYTVDSVCGGKKDWALRGRQFAYGRRRKVDGESSHKLDSKTRGKLEPCLRALESESYGTDVRCEEG